MRPVRIDVLVDSRADARRRDESARLLARDLGHVPGLVADPMRTDAVDDGSKAGVVEHAGELVLSGLLSVAGLKALSEVVVAFVSRDAARSITLRRGKQEITITGASARDVGDVVAKLDELLPPEQG
jgi:hypothetical protein